MVEEFRTLELTIFISQIISLFIYLILVRLYINLKTWLCTEEQLDNLNFNDPFWNLCVNGVSDFLAYDNAIMQVTTTLLTNIFLISYTPWIFWGQDTD